MLEKFILFFTVGYRYADGREKQKEFRARDGTHRVFICCIAGSLE
jgi:hypothetical protein